MFDGECDADNQILVYEGTGDNPGNTAAEKVAACSKACLTEKAPVDGKSWIHFVTKGFVVNPDGRCYCESAASTCKRSNNNFKRYDWTSQLGL